MKARIKKTGEIVNLASYAKITLESCDSWGNPLELKPEEVELIGDITEDEHWQDVHGRAAIAAMQGIMHGVNALIKQIWHKESEHPGNRHPYPVLNPDGEMAFAYYDELSGWQFDREFKLSANMLWLDIEKIMPKKD